MLYAIIGILAGVIIGLNLTYTIPLEYTKYSAVSIIIILDTVFGAIKSEFKKEENYNPITFLVGLLFNLVLGLGITFLGERLGLDLYIAVTVVFTIKIFSNPSFLRTILVEKLTKRKSLF